MATVHLHLPPALASERDKRTLLSRISCGTDGLAAQLVAPLALVCYVRNAAVMGELATSPPSRGHQCMPLNASPRT